MKLKQAICIVLAAFFAAAAPLGTQAASSIDQAKEKKQSLEKEKKNAQSTLDELKGMKSDLNAYVKKLDAELSKTEEEIAGLDEKLAAKEEEIADIQIKLDEAQKDADERYEDMKLRIKYMYERPRASVLDMLMGSADITDFLNRAEYTVGIGEYDREKLEEYEAAVAEVKSCSDTLETEKARLQEMQLELQGQRDDVAALIEAKKEELASYDSKIDAAQAKVAEYEKEIKQQDSTIKSLEAEIKRKEEAKKKAAQVQGKKYETVDLGSIHFTWPCPSSGRITSYFGGREQPVAGASTNHKGIDIGASSGSNIVAAAPGDVVISTYSASSGNYVMIHHGGGVYTVYMHASKLCCKEGDHVDRGQVIAKVGSTGYSTGPHLHFGIRNNGSYVNPLTYVSP